MGQNGLKWGKMRLKGGKMVLKWGKIGLKWAKCGKIRLKWGKMGLKWGEMEQNGSGFPHPLPWVGVLNLMFWFKDAMKWSCWGEGAVWRVPCEVLG